MFLGVILLCVAGPIQEFEIANSCITYYSVDTYETKEECEYAIKSVLKTDEMQAMLVMPEFDLELNQTECVQTEYFE